MIETQRVIALPCPILSLQIGNIVREIQETDSSSVKRQLELQLLSLEQLYEKQCGPKKTNDVQQAVQVGAQASIRFTNGALYLNVVTAQGNVVTVIFGGGDGVLITIDGKGVIHVLPPEGPGDPEVRQAVASVLQAINSLSAAATARAATATVTT